MRKILVLILTAALALGGCSRKSVEDKLIIPGTWVYDLDSNKLQGDSKVFPSWIKTFDVEMNFDYQKLNYGAKEEDSDIWWEHINRTQRKLVAKNGAKLVKLDKIDFEEINLEYLKSVKYSEEEIIGDDEKNQLKPGSIIGIKTNKGNYAKLIIDNYLPLVNRSQSERNIKNYNLQGRVVLYRK